MANIDSVKLPNGNEYNLQDVVSAKGSQPNLLINGWFTVNQRGYTSGGAASDYCSDRWLISLLTGGTGGGISVNADGSIHLVAGSSNLHITQRVELTSYDSIYKGKKFTLSILLSDGTVYHGTTSALPAKAGSGSTEVLNATVASGLTLYGYVADTTRAYDFQFRILVAAGSTFDIRACKLEVGENSTLALDTAPDYTTELLKCQRYFVRIKSSQTEPYLALCSNRTTTYAYCIIPLSVPMRIKPTLSVTGTLKLAQGTAEVSATIPSDPLHMSNNNVAFVITASSLTAGYSSVLYAESSGSYIDIDAEL